MKVKFYGTSHGSPEKDRFRSCTLIAAGGKNYILDAGGPLIDFLIRDDIKPESIEGIFITHMHGDHIDGLVSYCDLISWRFTAADPVIVLPKICGAEAFYGWMRSVCCGSVPRQLRFTETREGVIFDDGNMRVTAIRTRHCDVSYAMMFEAEGKRIVFTSDLAGPDIDFPKVCFEEQCDAVVCEAAHFSALKALPVFERCLTKRVFLTHILGSRHADEAVQAAKGYSLVAAYDGMTIEV